MEKFLNIVSQHSDKESTIADCLAQLGNLSSDANFAFIYVTDELTTEFPELIKKCKQTSGIEHWVGTIGSGIISTGKEWYDSPAISIMLAHFDPDEFTIVPLIGTINEIPDSLPSSHPFQTNFGVIHGDPYNQYTQDLIENLHQKLENGFLVGGLTSSSQFQYQVADHVQSGGISGVLFSEQIGVLTNLSQGCSPIGNKHQINYAENNIAHTLDQKPALNVLMEDMNITTLDELKKGSDNIFTGLCTPGSDQADYTVRDLIGIDYENKLVAINDDFTEHNDLIFCTRNKETAITDLQHMLDKLASRLNGTPKGGLYFSCLGRGREQFGDDSEEIQMIHNTLGDFPLTGFFANGEIHNNKLYGYTGVLTLFT